MPKNKSKKMMPQQPASKGSSIKVFGLILIIYSIIAFFLNWGILHFSVSSTFALYWRTFWDPLTLLTSKLVGHVWLISGFLAWFVNGFFAIVWSIAAFLLGVILVK
jgi:hypothetical protein